MAKSGVIATKKVSMKGIHGSLAKAIARLNKVKDPKAKKMIADLKTFQASIKCGQSMVFKFPAA
jgi:hypothetical protein